MNTIYILDTKMPIPNKEDNIDIFSDITDKPVEELNLSYSKCLFNWSSNEFNKILSSIGVTNKYIMPSTYFVFYKDDSIMLPEGFFLNEKQLVGIKYNDRYTGQESAIQQNAIHEITHVSTANHAIVGLAIAEGMAIYMVKKHCKLYGIPFDSDTRDEGYRFSLKLLEKIISSVYHNNLDVFFEQIKRNSEYNFINYINNYLKEKGYTYNASELLRLSSILFYAKKAPKSMLEEYIVSPEMEHLRDMLLKIIDSSISEEDANVDKYIASIKIIEKLREEFFMTMDLNTFTDLSTTFDRELGHILVNDKNDFFDKAIIEEALQKSIKLIKNTPQSIKK